MSQSSVFGHREQYDSTSLKIYGVETEIPCIPRNAKKESRFNAS